MFSAEHIVIAYRDRPGVRPGPRALARLPARGAGARLDHLSGVRPPIHVEDHPRQSFLSEVFDMVNPLDPVQAFPQLFNRNERPSLGPYCGKVERLDRSPRPRPA